MGTGNYSSGNFHSPIDDTGPKSSAFERFATIVYDVYIAGLGGPVYSSASPHPRIGALHGPSIATGSTRADFRQEFDELLKAGEPSSDKVFHVCYDLAVKLTRHRFVTIRSFQLATGSYTDTTVAASLRTSISFPMPNYSGYAADRAGDNDRVMRTDIDNFLSALRTAAEAARTDGGGSVGGIDTCVACHSSCHGSCHGARGRR